MIMEAYRPPSSAQRHRLAPTYEALAMDGLQRSSDAEDTPAYLDSDINGTYLGNRQHAVPTSSSMLCQPRTAPDGGEAEHSWVHTTTYSEVALQKGIHTQAGRKKVEGRGEEDVPVVKYHLPPLSADGHQKVSQRRSPSKHTNSQPAIITHAPSGLRSASAKADSTGIGEDIGRGPSALGDSGVPPPMLCVIPPSAYSSMTAEPNSAAVNVSPPTGRMANDARRIIDDREDTAVLTPELYASLDGRRPHAAPSDRTAAAARWLLQHSCSSDISRKAS